MYINTLHIHYREIAFPFDFFEFPGRDSTFHSTAIRVLAYN